MASGWVEGPEGLRVLANSVRVGLHLGPGVMTVQSEIRR